MNAQARLAECDELWSFCYAKAKTVARGRCREPGAGDLWTWTGIDRDTKLIISWHVGGRDTGDAFAFMDLGGRLADRVQLTTDGHAPYVETAEQAFADLVDYAQLVKHYRQFGGTERYIGAEKMVVVGRPEPAAISTSHVERHKSAATLLGLRIVSYPTTYAASRSQATMASMK